MTDILHYRTVILIALIATIALIAFFTAAREER
jgi:hypothetical protein